MTMTHDPALAERVLNAKCLPHEAHRYRRRPGCQICGVVVGFRRAGPQLGHPKHPDGSLYSSQAGCAIESLGRRIRRSQERQRCAGRIRRSVAGVSCAMVVKYAAALCVRV